MKSIKGRLVIALMILALCWVTYKPMPMSQALRTSAPPTPEGPPNYRATLIAPPAQGLMRHASTITPERRGGMVSAWYEGSREGARDVAILISHYDPAIGNWSAPARVVGVEEARAELGAHVKKIGNPVLHMDNAGRLWLFYSTVAVGGWSGASINCKVSADDGHTWGPSVRLITSPFFNISTNVKNKPIELADGTLLLPAYHEFISKYSVLMRVGYDGKSAHLISARRMTHAQDMAIQPSLVAGADGTLTAYLRNMHKGRVLVAQSADMGMKWSETAETPLPNPNSGLDMLGLHDGGVLGVVNYSTSERDNLSLIYSLSGSAGPWRIVQALEENLGYEYSYPAIALGQGGAVHVTYTFERKAIKHVTFDSAWFAGQAR